MPRKPIALPIQTDHSGSKRIDAPTQPLHSFTAHNIRNGMGDEGWLLNWLRWITEHGFFEIFFGAGIFAYFELRFRRLFHSNCDTLHVHASVGGVCGDGVGIKGRVQRVSNIEMVAIKAAVESAAREGAVS